MVVVVDNASQEPAHAPAHLPNGLACEVVRLDRNRSTGARNIGVQRAAAIAGTREDHWIVMLDDDSAPMDGRFVDALASTPRDVGAVAAEVFLPSDGSRVRHEAGGLPEVFTGCGAAIRACDFLALGGYDEAFDYYAEEYDFCARVILSGMRIAYDRRFRVLHRKVAGNRDQARIIANLARNNAWVMARYAPDGERARRIEAQFERYGAIAAKEGVHAEVDRVIAATRASLGLQPRREMTAAQWERFTGLAAAHAHLVELARQHAWRTCELVAPGKGVEDVAHAAERAGLRVLAEGEGGDVCVVGTLSPGVMLDAVAEWEARGKTVVGAWDVGGSHADG
jgi:GT2 family glycosyltransferase